MAAVSRSLRLVSAVLLTGALAAGCKYKETYDPGDAAPVQADPSLGIRIEMPKRAVAKPSNGDLMVPLRVTNDRNEAIFVILDRCEVETTAGTRVRARADRDDRVSIDPGHDEDFKVLFGSRAQPVTGKSFRVYLWIARWDGKLLDYVPPLVIEGGGGPFAYPPRPFSNDPQTGRPLSEEFPPVASPAAKPRDTKPCPICGEQRPVNEPTCPQCGAAW